MKKSWPCAATSSTFQVPPAKSSTWRSTCRRCCGSSDWRSRGRRWRTDAPTLLAVGPAVAAARIWCSNAHMDTSNTGREDFLSAIGYKPQAVVKNGFVYGLGIYNMKGALVCYTHV